MKIKNLKYLSTDNFSIREDIPPMETLEITRHKGIVQNKLMIAKSEVKELIELLKIISE